jgi:glycosyltransferase involved in cell wall biosynthesis
MKKKILHIQLLPLLSGVQNVMLHILQGLDPGEFEVYVACKPGGPLEEEIRKRGYTFLPLPLFVRPVSAWDAIILVQLYSLCRRYRFDIVHTHSSKPGLLGRLAARLAGVPLVIHTGHGAPFHPGQPVWQQRAYMLLEKLGACFCDRMVFVNHYHRKYYTEHKLIAPAKAVTIYNALNPGLQREIEQLSADRKAPEGMVTIGSVLRFSEQKNVVMTVAAAIKVCRERKDVTFSFIGDGELLELCRKMVNTNGLQDRILLPGWHSDTAHQLAGFDVFMLYSAYEGLPMSIIEAMFAGLPVIASDIPANAELVNADNGWLVPAGRQDLLEAALMKIIDDKVCYAQKGLYSRNKARELCSYEKFLRDYLGLYRGEK